MVVLEDVEDMDGVENTEHMEGDDRQVSGTDQTEHDNRLADGMRQKSYQVDLSHVICWTSFTDTRRKSTAPIFPRRIDKKMTLCWGTAAAVAEAGQVSAAIKKNLPPR